ncbi:hypothetical protein ARMSODRAFT_680279 [Armillaria solidipes]|uniref:Uncharacterized protein n=1 Tax=Armillaria solidipes TaxID=1076256 RepID=A0A2H3B8C7_9AGAR|nr:hypothetical protein ARMSODRAFT_680279 [Armillaria solidipes]
MPQYKQSFWIVDAGTGDIGAAKRAQIAKAALALNGHDDIILSTSAGGYTTTERPEIALVVPVDYNPTTLHVAVEQALATEQLSVKAYLQGDVRYYDLGQTELVNIAAVTKIVDLAAARNAIDEVARIPLQPVCREHIDVAVTLKSFISGASNVSPNQFAEGFSITAAKYQQLKAARSDTINTEIDGLSKSFDALSKETKTNAATAIMVASGLVTLGKTMYTLYTAVQSAGSVAALVSTLLAAVGGIAGVAAIVAIIAVTFGLAWIHLKE